MAEQDRLARIRERCEKAAPGPWRVVVKGNTVKSHAIPGVCSGISPKTANADFITHAREDMPWLLDRIAELERQTDIAVAEYLVLESDRNVWRTKAEMADEAWEEATARAERAEAERGDILDRCRFYQQEAARCHKAYVDADLDRAEEQRKKECAEAELTRLRSWRATAELYERVLYEIQYSLRDTAASKQDIFDTINAAKDEAVRRAGQEDR